MKKIVLFAIAIFNCFLADAQLIPCRPKICLIDYNYHDDASPNADMTAILAALPDILIDNTPGGYWGGGCLPPQYTPSGIEVFSYITGGYEGTEYGTTEDELNSNLARVDAIASDGATGVFLDEVSSHPDVNSKNYISAIYNECQTKGIKLILNPGISDFDSWLMSNCDYLMSDEVYDGTRIPTSSESPFADRLLVVNQGITDATSAAAITQGAFDNSFGYSYACKLYTSLPAWLGNYVSLVMQSPPATPVITQYGNSLESDVAYGNQWYEQTTGIISGETGQNYIPGADGIYYDIVTLSGCSSDTSNNINVIISGIESSENNKAIRVFPNPAFSEITIRGYNPSCVKLCNRYGQIYTPLVLPTFPSREGTKGCVIDIGDLPQGLYLLQLFDAKGLLVKTGKVMKE